MSSDRFGGSMIIPASGRDPFRRELDASVSQFTEYGFKLPSDITGAGLLAGTAGAFAPEELGPAQAIPDVSRATQLYFGREVRPRLVQDTEAGSPKALGLARQFGRLIGAAQQTGHVHLESSKDFSITNTDIIADGIRQPYDIETGWVADLGMGVTGIMNHLRNVKAEKYRVLGLQKTVGEAALLQGIAAQRGLAAERMLVFGGGIKHNTDKLLETSGEHVLDIIIASRVHSAGKDLEAGIQQTAALLRAGGLLVARGPRHYKATDYDKILDIVQHSPLMRIIADQVYQRQTPHGQAESNRAFIAQVC